jgi:hypothetical protein
MHIYTPVVSCGGYIHPGGGYSKYIYPCHRYIHPCGGYIHPCGGYIHRCGGYIHPCNGYTHLAWRALGLGQAGRTTRRSPSPHCVSLRHSRDTRGVAVDGMVQNGVFLGVRLDQVCRYDTIRYSTILYYTIVFKTRLDYTILRNEHIIRYRIVLYCVVLCCTVLRYMWSMQPCLRSYCL